ncbi:histone-lysine N-methyltransferase SETMAR-like [Tachysurus ichikawai]
MLSLWWDFKGAECVLSAIRRFERIHHPELVNCKGSHKFDHPSTMIVAWMGCVATVHPPHTPDPAPSDFHLFRSLQNFLRGLTFHSDEAGNRHLGQFFADKEDRTFYERGIMQLTESWQNVIEQNWQYVIG